MEAVQAARRHGTIVSYDLNYRPSLWKSIGGQKRAQEVNREIARHVDVMIGNEEDFTACLGFEVEGVDEHISRIEVAAFKKMIGKAVKAYPNFKVVATTLRAVRTATRNDWGAICWAGGKFYEAPNREELEILDRVGGGDSFASGLIYGLMRFNDAQKAVEYGAAHGALAMTTPGDTSMASLKEVEALVKGGSARGCRGEPSTSRPSSRAANRRDQALGTGRRFRRPRPRRGFLSPVRGLSQPTEGEGGSAFRNKSSVRSSGT